MLIYIQTCCLAFLWFQQFPMVLLLKHTYMRTCTHTHMHTTYCLADMSMLFQHSAQVLDFLITFNGFLVFNILL